MKPETKNNTREVDVVRESQTNATNTMFDDWYPVRCTLFGTAKCPNPDCPGYGAVCADSMNHSGR